MTSISPINNNSTALTLLRTANQTKASAPSQSAASQILASMIPGGKDPMQMAEGTISRILYGNGQIITGASFSSVKGSDGDDIIRTGAGSSVDGGAGDDNIEAGPGSSVSGGAGNDHIEVSAGSQVSGDEGNDYIRAVVKNSVNGGDGDDGIDAFIDNHVDGGAGNDVVNAFGYGNQINGGDGDDSISSWANNVVSGGAGNDTIKLFAMPGHAGSTVTYFAGDGKDTIDLLGGDSTLKLGKGLSSENTHIAVSGNSATISFDNSDADEITVNLEKYLTDNDSLTVAFDDGTTQNIDWGSDALAGIKFPFAQNISDQPATLPDASAPVPNDVFSAYAEH